MCKCFCRSRLCAKSMSKINKSCSIYSNSKLYFHKFFVVNCFTLILSFTILPLNFESDSSVESISWTSYRFYTRFAFFDMTRKTYVSIGQNLTASYGILRFHESLSHAKEYNFNSGYYTKVSNTAYKSHAYSPIPRLTSAIYVDNA